MSKRRRMGGRTKESKRRAKARERRQAKQAKQPCLLVMVDRDVLLSAARERAENERRSRDAIWDGVLKHMAERCIRDDYVETP